MAKKGAKSPTISVDEEKTLRQERQVLDGIREAYEHPIPADPKKSRIPPSERVNLTERVKQVQRHRDDLLVENALLRRIVHKLLDQTDVRRDNGRKGGRERSTTVATRNDEWRACAAFLKERNPRLRDAGLAKRIKQTTRCDESVRTIRSVLGQTEVGSKP